MDLQPRVQAGKKGGEWTGYTRAQNTSLAPGMDLDFEDNYGGRKGANVAPDLIDISAERMLKVSRYAVENFARHKTAGRAEVIGFSAEDVEDMAQDAVVATLHLQAIQSKHASAGQVRLNAHDAVVAGVHGDLNAVNAKARQLLDDQVDSRVQSESRMLRRVEVDAIANRIRAGWADRRHLPTDGFQYAPLEREAAVGLGPDSPQPPVRASVAAGSRLALALQSAEMVGGKPQARRGVWDALAGAYDAPSPTRTLNARAATVMRAAVAAAGGVVTAAKAWDDGQDTDATRALFAPFGDLDDNAKSAVVNMLLDRSAYAEELWGSTTIGSPRLGFRTGQ